MLTFADSLHGILRETITLTWPSGDVTSHVKYHEIERTTMDAKVRTHTGRGTR